MLRSFIPLVACLFIIVSIFSACDFETIVEVDIPQGNPKLVVNSVLTPDSVIKVSVTASRHILDNNDYSYIQIANATVSLSLDNGSVVTLPYHVNDDLYYLENFKAQENISYSLQVSANGYETVTALTSLQPGIILDKIEKGGKVNDENGSLSTVFWLYFRDPPDQENFYKIEAFKEYRSTNPQTGQEYINQHPLYIETTDPAFAEDYNNGNGVLLNDVLFNGKNYRFPILIPDYTWQSENQKITFHLKTLNKDFYNYAQTKTLQEYVNGDPFAQPVLVYNNINNGFGVFGGYSTYTIEYNP